MSNEELKGDAAVEEEPKVEQTIGTQAPAGPIVQGVNPDGTPDGLTPEASEAPVEEAPAPPVEEAPAPEAPAPVAPNNEAEAPMEQATPVIDPMQPVDRG